VEGGLADTQIPGDLWDRGAGGELALGLSELSDDLLR
jgi:hypothetical protein